MASRMPWTAAELAVVAAHPGMTSGELAALLPGRSSQAVGNLRARHFGRHGNVVPRDEPQVKEPGEYTEHLSAYLVDEFECMEIWLKWNGYASYREAGRDKYGWVTLVCTAK
jgi:hypothetical protein